MMIRLLAIGLTYCVVSNAGYSDYDWGAMSGRLSPNATEQQVMSVVGYRPNKVELQTCGADAPNGAWQCKIFTFGNVYSNLRVYFYEDGSDVWRVNSWQVYP